jgi:hypothetical protein
MSKCRPKATEKMASLESYGVKMLDVSETARDRYMNETMTRNVVISIPYGALRENKQVQLAFQDLVTISTDE